MTVELITAATPEIHEAMGRLLPQLSRSAAPMSEADVERFLAQSGVHLFVFRPDTADAEGNHPILGMLSLATFEIPTEDPARHGLTKTGKPRAAARSRQAPWSASHCSGVISSQRPTSMPAPASTTFVRCLSMETALEATPHPT